MPLIRIQKTGIYYTKCGKGHPLIFLHASFYDSGGYKELIDILNKHYQVYAVDMPMHGKSDKPNRYLSIKDFSILLEGFTRKLGLKNPVICAHSAGTLVALEYASKNKVKELLLIEPAGVERYDSAFKLLFKIFIVKASFGFLRNPVKAVKLNLIGIRVILRNFFNKNYWKMAVNESKANYIPQMKRIKAPVKLFWAKHDEMLPIGYAKIFLKNIKNSKLITIEGNHDWPILKPERIIKHV